jgi:hypothetical protein
MLILLFIFGCHSPAETVAGEVQRRENLFVDVVARVASSGAAAAWDATASLDPSSSVLLPGECVVGSAPVSEPASAPASAPVLGSLRIAGAMSGALLGVQGRWKTVSGLQAGDPAWSVADLLWSRADGLAEQRVVRAVRFGPSPRVRELERRPDGDLFVRWDPQSVENGEIAVTGASGDARCGVGSGGVVLPAWVLPRVGGEVRLRSIRVHEEPASADLRIRVRAVLERVIPIDAPPAEVAPVALPPAPLGPRLGPVRTGRVRAVMG